MKKTLSFFVLFIFSLFSLELFAADKAVKSRLAQGCKKDVTFNKVATSEATPARNNVELGRKQIILSVKVGELNKVALRGDVASKLLSSSNKLGEKVNWLEREGIFKRLAESNLVALDGEQADLHIGGEIPVPVMQDGKVQAVEYKPYGVEVKFIPKILTKDKVMLFIEPNVVEAHYDYSPRVGSFNVPVMTRSHTRTKLQMKLGETMMIAGLMKDSFAASTSLGFFSPSTSFAKDSSEVVIIVTPYLVDNHLAEPVLPGEGMNEEAEISKMLNRMAILSGNDDSKVGFMKE